MSEIRIIRRSHKANSIADVRLTNNYVLCRRIHDNLETPTKDGIYKGSYKFHQDQFLASHADRVYEVIKLPDGLTFWTPTNKTSGNCLRWKTDIEVEVGDAVWVSYMAVIDYDCLVIDGTEYALINYSEFRLAKKKTGDVVMLNGWVLYKPFTESRSSVLIDPKPTIDHSKGIVYLTGSPNKSYVVNDKKWVDLDRYVDLKPGDVFLKKSKHDTLLLEDPVFQYFAEENLYLILRKNIVAIIDSNEAD
jgi:hypothetical protein